MAEVGLQKTLVFLLFIAIGVFLKAKFKSKEELSGIKKIILNLALPATIFIALLGIEVNAELLLLPFLALALNIFLLVVIPRFLPLFGLEKGTKEYRTASLLLPSLAPGLSCFPFVLEFLGDTYLAKAAMADLGNKFFVLMVLYWIAMNLHFKTQHKKGGIKIDKIKGLLKVLFSEPVNLFILSALLLLVFGFSLDQFPFVFQDALQKLSFMMTPLVLLFIGLAVKLKRKQFWQLTALLSLRAGIALVFVGILATVFKIENLNDILLLMAFSLCACSFWPYAHIATITVLEDGQSKKTFSSDLSIAILALSFPFSTVLALGVLNSGKTFEFTPNIFLAALILIGLGLTYPAVLRTSRKLKNRDVGSVKIEGVHPEHGYSSST